MNQRFLIKVSYGGAKKKEHRLFGTWSGRGDAQEVADRWRARVVSHFFGDISFEVVALDSKDISIKQLREEIREAGMN